MNRNKFDACRDNRGQPIAEYYGVQESRSYEGSVVRTYLTTATTTTTTTLTPSPTLWRVTDRAGVECLAKGVRIRPGASAGNLVVHLFEDFDAAGAKAYTTYQFAAVGADEQAHREGLIFDEILEAGTTLALLDYVKILL